MKKVIKVFNENNYDFLFEKIIKEEEKNFKFFIGYFKLKKLIEFLLNKIKYMAILIFFGYFRYNYSL